MLNMRGRGGRGHGHLIEQARMDFAEAWSPVYTDADFEGYRRQRAWTA